MSVCDWADPGHDPYQGPVPAAVERFAAEIPPEVRKALRARMEKHQYDEIVEITRNRIAGAYEYTDLRMMLFGKGRLCKQVSRLKWTAEMVERGLIYCEREAGGKKEHCLIVPTVCRNVSIVTRGDPVERKVPELSIIPLPPAPPLYPPLFEGLPDLPEVEYVPRPWSEYSRPAPLPRSFDQPVWHTPPWAVLPPPVQVVSEPSTTWLLLVGIAALAWRRLREVPDV